MHLCAWFFDNFPCLPTALDLFQCVARQLMTLPQTPLVSWGGVYSLPIPYSSASRSRCLQCQGSSCLLSSAPRWPPNKISGYAPDGVNKNASLTHFAGTFGFVFQCLLQLLTIITYLLYIWLSHLKQLMYEQIMWSIYVMWLKPFLGLPSHPNSAYNSISAITAALHNA